VKVCRYFSKIAKVNDKTIKCKLLSKYRKPEVTIQHNGDLRLNEQAPVTIEFLRKHTDNGVMEPLK